MTSLKMVKILEVTRVAPSPDSPNCTEELSHPLTFFDTYWFKFRSTQCLYFYYLTEFESNPSYFYPQILPRLKKSLSLALVHFLPLAGYLKWQCRDSMPSIVYTPNNGISLTVAESSTDNFHILASNEMHKANEFQSLSPKLVSWDDKSEVLSLQITLFPHQGFCIGKTARHAVVDGMTGSMFFRSWANLCKQFNGIKEKNTSLSPKLIPHYDRSIIKDPAGLDLLFLNQWLAYDGQFQDPNKRSLKVDEYDEIPDDVFRATFEFSYQDIQKLRETVLSKLGSNGKQLHLSSFVLTLAYISTCLVKTKGEADRLVVIDFAVDCRAHLDPPLPQNYFGNCVMYFAGTAQPKNFIEQDGFLFAVEMLSDQVQEAKRSVLEGVEKKVFHFFIPRLPGLQVIDVSGSPKLKFYDADFGIGKLKKVDYLSIHMNNSISMTESRHGNGGIEIGLAMKKHEMETFTSLFYNGLKQIA